MEYDSLNTSDFGLKYKVENQNVGIATYFRTVVKNYLVQWSKENGYDLFADGLKIYVSLTASDTFGNSNYDERLYNVVSENFAPEIVFNDIKVCSSNCEDYANYSTYNSEDEIFEDDNILIDVSDTFDATETGELNFEWSKYILDFDQNAIPKIKGKITFYPHCGILNLSIKNLD